MAGEEEPNFDVTLSRFATVSTAEQKKLLERRQSKSTREQTKCHMNILRMYLMEKNLPKIEEIQDAELPNILKDFYSSVRKEDSGMYKLASLKCIHASLNRFMKEERNIDIIADPRFIQANHMFKAMSVETKHQGKAVTVSKKVIEECDLQKIAEHFHHDHTEEPDPKLLQQNILFNVIYFFVCRGRENLHSMTKDWFRVVTDPNTQQKYIEQCHDELDKNHGPQYTGITNEGRMYEQKGQFSFFWFSLSRSVSQLNGIL